MTFYPGLRSQTRFAPGYLLSGFQPLSDDMDTVAMTIDPRLWRIIAAQPYPLLFATISGAHLYGFPSPENDRARRGWLWQDVGVGETE